jgi:hypothetical protein
VHQIGHEMMASLFGRPAQAAAMTTHTSVGFAGQRDVMVASHGHGLVRLNGAHWG